jgi:hypothetical protein
MHIRKDRIRLLQASIIGAAILAGAPAIFAEEQLQEDTKQQVYIDQMAKYPVLSKEFHKEIAANAHPRLAPSENENLFFWQLEDYKMLNAGFADVYARNVAPREVPATPEEVYLWQLEPYKELDKEFHDALQPQL